MINTEKPLQSTGWESFHKNACEQVGHKKTELNELGEINYCAANEVPSKKVGHRLSPRNLAWAEQPERPLV